MDSQRSQGVTRRTALRGAAVGAGLVWAAPVVTTIASPALAATSPFPCEPCTECDPNFDVVTGECACYEGNPGFNPTTGDCCTAGLTYDPDTDTCIDIVEEPCTDRSPAFNPRTGDCCTDGERYNAATGACGELAETGAPIALGLAAGTGLVATGATLAALAARRSTVEQADTSDPAASAEPPAEPRD